MLNIQSLNEVPCLGLRTTNYSTLGTVTIQAFLDVGNRSNYKSVRVGFLNQDSRGSHYNDVTHLSIDGTVADRSQLKRFAYSGDYVDLLTKDRYGTIAVVGPRQYWGFKYEIPQRPDDALYYCGVFSNHSYVGDSGKIWPAITDYSILMDTSGYQGDLQRVRIAGTLRLFESDLSCVKFQRELSYYVTITEFTAKKKQLASLRNQAGILDPPEWVSAALSERLDEDVNKYRDVYSSYIPSRYITAALDLSNIELSPYSVDAIVGPVMARNPNWGDLAREAYQDLGTYQGNGIALIRDILGCTTAAKATVKTIRSLSHNPKAISDLFLSFHYGWKLLFLDLKELRHSLAAVKKVKKCQASQTYPYKYGTVTARYQVFYEEYTQLANLLDLAVAKFDLELSGRTAWDFIPFSFVVDWFIQIEEVLTSLDNYYRLTRRHKVVAAGRSIKCVCPVQAGQLGLPSTLAGNLTAKFYRRRYGNPIAPSLLPSVTEKLLPFHYVEGAALIVSAR